MDRHLPKTLHKARKRKVEQVEKARRKDTNRKKHSKPETHVVVKEKASAVVKVVD